MIDMWQNKHILFEVFNTHNLESSFIDLKSSID